MIINQICCVALAMTLSGHALNYPAHEGDEPASRAINFPDTADGEHVLAIDTHTHSVFSDGEVWPTLRMREAERDSIDAVVFTEHLEEQRHSADIPHPDRNRAFQVGLSTASPALAINGAEITRGYPYGHMNAIFLTDANALLTSDAREAVRLARAQGGLITINHPWGPRRPDQIYDGGVLLSRELEALIQEGSIDAIEVANGHIFSQDSFDIAVQYNLAVIGASDLHTVVDYAYDIQGGDQRTVTLVITDDPSSEGIKEAIVRRRSVALFRHNIIGLRSNVEEIVSGSLELYLDEYNGDENRILPAKIHNSSSSSFSLSYLGNGELQGLPRIFEVPPYGTVNFGITEVASIESVLFRLRINNSVVEGGEPLEMTLSPIE